MSKINVIITDVIIFLFFYLFLGCEKDPKEKKETIIYGKVIDSESGSPLPGAAVYVLDYVLMSGSRYDTLSEVTTDMNGNFELKTNLTIGIPGESHANIVASKIGYKSNWANAPFPGTISEVIFNMQLYAVHQIHIQNKAPAVITDAIEVSTAQNYYFSELYRGFGDKVDTMITYYHDPLKDSCIIKWRILINNIYQTNDAKLSCKRGNTSINLITY